MGIWFRVGGSNRLANSFVIIQEDSKFPMFFLIICFGRKHFLVSMQVRFQLLIHMMSIEVTVIVPLC